MSPMHSIAVVSRKGGAGKSTVAVQLAVGLSLRRRVVVLADTDPQRSSLEVMRNRPSESPERMSSSASKLFALQSAARRAGADTILIDTPAVVEEEMAQIIGLADVAIMVLRPTYLDLAAAVNTSRVIRQLGKPGIIVLNQAPVQRGGVEPPQVKRTLEALKLLRLPISPVILRYRAIHQRAMEMGRSAEEIEPESAGGREVSQLCDFIADYAFSLETTPQYASN
jgi:chromosome partitioning protein